jgi:hypothetical protein
LVPFPLGGSEAGRLLSRAGRPERRVLICPGGGGPVWAWVCGGLTEGGRWWTPVLPGVLAGGVCGGAAVECVAVGLAGGGSGVGRVDCLLRAWVAGRCEEWLG